MAEEYDEEFGPNRTPVCSDCGERLLPDEICWCEGDNVKTS